MTTESVQHEIRCAEIWGGVHPKQDEITTPGVRAVIHSTASGDDKGGDLYYFSVCAYDSLTRIAIADVRGHGLAASQISEWLYDSLESRMNDPNGAAVLEDLNNIVRKRGFEAITTAAIATFHRDKGELYYCYAGHPPLILNRLGQVWRELPAPSVEGPINLPLGVVPNARYVQEKVLIGPGDRLFVYTDGVSECPGGGSTPDLEMFGDKKMPQVLNELKGHPLTESGQVIHRALLEHAGGLPAHDDCTFMFVEVLKPPPFWRRRILPGRSRASRPRRQRLSRNKGASIASVRASKPPV